MKGGLVIWDVDGTLLETAIDFPALKRALWRQVAEGGGAVPEDPAALTLEAAVEAARMLDRRHGGHLADRLWQEIERAEEAGERAAPRPGAREALARTGKAGLVSVALTNNRRERAQRALAGAGLGHLLAGVYGREDVPALKPSPEGVRWILAQHRPPWAAVVGDSWVDAAAAHGAGLPFVSVVPLAGELARRGLGPALGGNLSAVPQALQAAAGCPGPEAESVTHGEGGGFGR